MRKAILGFVFGTLFLALLAFLVLEPSTAQEETAEFKLWSSYWTVEPGFTSTLEMKNNRVDETLSARVVLYLSNQREYYLDPIRLEPRQTVTVNLNQVYESIPASLRAGATQEGSLGVEFSHSYYQAVMGGVSVTNPEIGAAWNFRLYSTFPTESPVPARGLFWFYDESTDGFIAAQNASDEFITLEPRFHINGQVHAVSPVGLAPGQALKLELRKELRQLGMAGVTAGGIELRYTAESDALRAHGVLLNKQGFSSEIDFHHRDFHEKASTFTLRTPRVAFGPADSRLGLSAGTAFDPILALQNFGETELPVLFSVGYQTAEGPQEVQDAISLRGGETRVAPLRTLLPQEIPDDVPWTSLEVSYVSNENYVAADLVSVSQDGEHSIRSVMNPVRGSTVEGWVWRADQTFGTLVGILNTDTEEATVKVSLDYYADGEPKSYQLPDLTIPPRVSELVDVGAILAAGEPDENGNVIPPGVDFGGYRVQKVGPRLGKPINVEALVFNHQTKSFLALYNTCCAIFNVSFNPTLIAGPPGGGGQMLIEGVDCSSQLVNLTTSGDFFSGSTGIATVGLHTGGVSLISPGSTDVDASLEYWSFGFFVDPCLLTLAAAATIINVDEPPRVDSISPARGLIGTTTTVTISGSGFGTSPTVQAGNGITVTISSASNTSITANLAVAVSSPAGNHSVTVTSGGQTSNAVNFFVQVSTSFDPLGVIQTDLMCSAGTSGVGVHVFYQVLDQEMQPIAKAGLTPREHVEVNGSPVIIGFMSFAKPQITDPAGKFNDVPVGTCYSGTAGNPCVDVVQIFDILVPTNTGVVPYTIGTLTSGRDCRLGIRLDVFNTGKVLEHFIFGTVN